MIVFALPASGGFLPFGSDESVALQPVQYGIKHPIAPFDLAATQFPHSLNDLVPVTFPLGEDGKQERFGGGGHHVFRKHGTLIH